MIVIPVKAIATSVPEPTLGTIKLSDVRNLFGLYLQKNPIREPKKESDTIKIEIPTGRFNIILPHQNVPTTVNVESYFRTSLDSKNTPFQSIRLSKADSELPLIQYEYSNRLGERIAINTQEHDSVENALVDIRYKEGAIRVCGKSIDRKAVKSVTLRSLRSEVEERYPSQINDFDFILQLLASTITELNKPNTKISVPSRVNITGLRREAVVAALYNGASQFRAGYLAQDSNKITENDALRLIHSGSGCTECTTRYQNGRFIFVRFKGDYIDVEEYDKNNGIGHAQKVVDALRRTGDPACDEIIRLHRCADVKNVSDPHATTAVFLANLLGD